LTTSSGTIWIDLDNSPHVPFFRPIIEELARYGHRMFVTARDAYNVRELLALHRMDCVVVGRHLGKNKLMKVAGTCVRSGQLLRHAAPLRPRLAVSHGSRAQMLAAKLMRVPSVVIADYEHVTHITRPECLIVPELIPRDAIGNLSRQVLTYPGIKEDVYSSAFKPDSAIFGQLGLGASDVVVTMRPPATEAHYHCAQSEELFDAAIDMVAGDARTRGIVLPRNERQHEEVARRFGPLLASRKLLVPNAAVDGLNLVWHSDLVISGGGTMNREAAALGVPVYSTFRGPIGAVDRYLAAQGRLTLLESAADVRQRVKLVPRDRGQGRQRAGRASLDAIVNHLLRLSGGFQPASAVLDGGML
jgi:uncharacterized protein